MKPLLVSSGEPAGIGPDLCLSLAGLDLPLVVIGDKQLLMQRAKALGFEVEIQDYKPQSPLSAQPGQLTVLSLPCPAPVVAGQLDVRNAPYVLDLLTKSANACLAGEFSALVTAPVHKAIINKAGIAFTGHTEFFADYCRVNQVVMMLACDAMKVALVTTHLPLSEVPQAITQDLIIGVARQVHQSLQRDFGIREPRIAVAGLNPHAGEGGYLGREEIDVIEPALTSLRQQGIDVSGPYPADTLFATQKATQCDVYLTMYHDQGLPVLKYAGFNHAVNITLGLPFIRTSVDHGTALELAGTGHADTGSLFAAVRTALTMVQARGHS
ncbi:4-hydroxythreonine-4-phosphate dehydrogenase PdxA [Legionella taurinensis]|uniref:4-hydroxythreonine-4-phosphate dehydrogenase n=1 Tax=Legionella taurinensis TaxID=70611 RepID=A0AB38N9L9_9GAMM|nr:4-hydroxythreonine-4-phosphate dehydrogenase PdxA [Legionella taurinensis]MDX1836385.1 4-hydroxythreonine-4-phosphate dehydrogenase PdxA [Legionella taurinensis]PUT41867.1 4-hydroxythreonine-4-phosphate dehydrogenase PdxA [Legionella taurinensis]PUT44655.1 4-hydroxythreonine-4-phosphate dehydrogenase PdxA [Legionella taurinensis]PUT47975.1 4-hydroxythreonine-4-phosphate dehydrogenase PdxA [Legionella taurinensis]PUT48789.1 4-hydroxythreonine-4-phosphate dehydrogenase PdxA [Legionella taurin